MPATVAVTSTISTRTRRSGLSVPYPATASCQVSRAARRRLAGDGDDGGLHRVLDDRHDVVTVREAHLGVELGELELTVGRGGPRRAGTRHLVVAVEAADHGSPA